jgi:hypothetical protein
MISIFFATLAISSKAFRGLPTLMIPRNRFSTDTAKTTSVQVLPKRFSFLDPSNRKYPEIAKRLDPTELPEFLNYARRKGITHVVVYTPVVSRVQFRYQIPRIDGLTGTVGDSGLSERFRRHFDDVRNSAELDSWLYSDDDTREYLDLALLSGDAPKDIKSLNTLDFYTIH